MHQTTHFFNLGYGWLCKHCSAEEAERRQRNKLPEVGQKVVNLALAKWIDEGRHGLTCPRCGIREVVSRT